MATWTGQTENSASWSTTSESLDPASTATAGQAMGVLGLTYAGGEILSSNPTQWTFQTED